MKRCPKCGNLCEDDSAFCGECGMSLGRSIPEESERLSRPQLQPEPQFQSGMPVRKSAKVPVLVAVIVILIGIVAFLGFKIYQSDKPENQKSVKKAMSQTVEQKKEDKTEVADTETDTETGTDAQAEETVNADLNAVDKAYFDINGKIVLVNGVLYIEIDTPVSLYAQNEQKKNVLLDSVDKFKLKDGNELNGYVGDQAVVSGKISLDGSNKPVLFVDSYEVADSVESAEDTAIHRYQIVVTDCSWDEAFEQCRQMGGYLVRINSYEEYAAIVNQIQNEGYEKIHFYLGGRRNSYDSNYCWVNENDELMDDGPALNSVDAWCASAWMTGEPSYVDGDTQEMYMNMFYYKSNLAWVLNDVPDDITGVYPGQTGYICEFED